MYLQVCGCLSWHPKANLTWPLNISILAIFPRFNGSVTLSSKRSHHVLVPGCVLEIPQVYLTAVCVIAAYMSAHRAWNLLFFLSRFFPAVLGAFVQDCRNIPEVEPPPCWLLLFEWVGWGCLLALEIMPAWKRVI